MGEKDSKQSCVIQDCLVNNVISCMTQAALAPAGLFDPGCVQVHNFSPGGNTPRLVQEHTVLAR